MRATEASLILGKVYRIVPDARAAKDHLVRIIDESGEDYLFARSPVRLCPIFPQNVRRKILAGFKRPADRRCTRRRRHCGRRG